MRQGDVIIALDGEKLADNNALRNRIAGTKPGSKVAVEILREGRKETLQATLDAKDPDSGPRRRRAETPRTHGASG